MKHWRRQSPAMSVSLLLLLCISLVSAAQNTSSQCPRLDSIQFETSSQLMHHLTDPCRYNKMQRPGPEHEPLMVNTRVHVYMFSFLPAHTLQYRLHLLLEMRFQDSRLAYHDIAPHILKVTGEEQLKSLIWVPHIFIGNEQGSTVMGTRAKDTLVTVYPDGVVVIAVRLKTSLFCWMKLHKFPFDDQQCPLTLESSSLFKTDRLLLEWEENTPVTITPHSYLTEYRIIGLSTNTTSGTTSATLMESGIVGNYSALMVTFHLSRKMGFYAMDYYVPSILLVAISWVSFWLDANALSGRINIGCSTMLTFIMLSSKTGRDLPKVSYIKASEIWFMTCTAFIFGSLVEFAFVNTIWRRRNNVQLKKVNSKYILKSTLTPKLARKDLDQRKPSLERSTSCPPNVIQKKMGLEMISRRRPSMMQSDISLATFPERSQQTTSNFLSVPGTGSSSNLAEEAMTDCSFDGRESTAGNQGSTSSLRARVRRLSVVAFTTMTPQDIAKWIDTRSRVVFPVCFLIFNALYWSFVWL